MNGDKVKWMRFFGNIYICPLSLLLCKCDVRGTRPCGMHQMTKYVLGKDHANRWFLTVASRVPVYDWKYTRWTHVLYGLCKMYVMSTRPCVQRPVCYENEYEICVTYISMQLRSSFAAVALCSLLWSVFLFVFLIDSIVIVMLVKWIIYIFCVSFLCPPTWTYCHSIQYTVCSQRE